MIILVAPNFSYLEKSEHNVIVDMYPDSSVDKISSQQHIAHRFNSNYNFK